MRKVRITHLGSEGVLTIRTIRQDVPNAEPHTLGNELQLAPGEAVVVAVYSRCALLITECHDHSLAVVKHQHSEYEEAELVAARVRALESAAKGNPQP
jgi:hypothetical protein